MSDKPTGSRSCCQEVEPSCFMGGAEQRTQEAAQGRGKGLHQRSGQRQVAQLLGRCIKCSRHKIVHRRQELLVCPLQNGLHTSQ